MAIEHVTDRTHERIPSTLLVVERRSQRGCEWMGRVQLVELHPARTMGLDWPLADQRRQRIPEVARGENATLLGESQLFIDSSIRRPLVRFLQLRPLESAVPGGQARVRMLQKGCPLHICDEHAEGAFVPTAAFMRNSPTWRLDVLGDILLDIQRAQQHAAVELFRELSRNSPEVRLERQIHGFRRACERLGVVLPRKRGGVDRAGTAVHFGLTQRALRPSAGCWPTMARPTAVATAVAPNIPA